MAQIATAQTSPCIIVEKYALHTNGSILWYFATNCTRSVPVGYYQRAPAWVKKKIVFFRGGVAPRNECRRKTEDSAEFQSSRSSYIRCTISSKVVVAFHPSSVAIRVGSIDE